MFELEFEHTDLKSKKKLGTWSAYIEQATTSCTLTSAIPLLLNACSLNCLVSDLVRFPHIESHLYQTLSLVRTPDQRATSGRRAPALKPSSSSSLALASITGPATETSR